MSDDKDAPMNGRIINPLALERRLTIIESKLDGLERKLEDWTKSHEAWGISQSMQTIQRMDALQEVVSELRTSNAVCSNRWDNHADLHDKHVKEHEAIQRKERAIDVIVGTVASAIAIVTNIISGKGP